MKAGDSSGILKINAYYFNFNFLIFKAILGYRLQYFSMVHWAPRIVL